MNIPEVATVSVVFFLPVEREKKTSRGGQVIFECQWQARLARMEVAAIFPTPCPIYMTNERRIDDGQCR